MFHVFSPLLMNWQVPLSFCPYVSLTDSSNLLGFFQNFGIEIIENLPFFHDDGETSRFDATLSIWSIDFG